MVDGLRQRIFRLGKTTRATGTGVGMYNTWITARDHKGRVAAVNYRKGNVVGARFIISLFVDIPEAVVMRQLEGLEDAERHGAVLVWSLTQRAQGFLKERDSLFARGIAKVFDFGHQPASAADWVQYCLEARHSNVVTQMSQRAIALQDRALPLRNHILDAGWDDEFSSLGEETEDILMNLCYTTDAVVIADFIARAEEFIEAKISGDGYAEQPLLGDRATHSEPVLEDDDFDCSSSIKMGQEDQVLLAEVSSRKGISLLGSTLGTLLLMALLSLIPQHAEATVQRISPRGAISYIETDSLHVAQIDPAGAKTYPVMAWDRIGRCETVQSVAHRYNATFVANGPYYSVDTRHYPLGVVVIDGIPHAFAPFQRTVFILTNDNRPLVITPEEEVHLQCVVGNQMSRFIRLTERKESRSFFIRIFTGLDRYEHGGTEQVKTGG